MIVPCVYCTTEKEAEMIGYFVKGVFGVMREWEEESKEGWEMVREKMIAGTYNRVSTTLCSCFDSSDYMKQRNSLIMLWKLIPEFPTSMAMADQLLTYTRKVAASGTSDLKVLAQRYCDKLARLKVEKWGDNIKSPSTSTANRPSPSSPGLLSMDEGSGESGKRPRDVGSDTPSSGDQDHSSVVSPKKRSRFS